MMRKKFTTAVAVAALLISGALVSTPATATEGPAPLPPVALANPDVPLEVIETLPEVVQQSDVKLVDYEPGDLIYYPDGTLVEGQGFTAQLAARICQGIRIVGAPGSWVPSGGQLCTSALWGAPGVTVGYKFGAHPSTVTYGCLQGLGYNSAGAKTWYGIGCGTSSARANIPWGNVLARPGARAMSNGITGVTLEWSIL